MVKWVDLCAPKDFGGICILASRRMNVALMLRWVWRILKDDGGLLASVGQGQISKGTPTYGM
jgi:hypothetical protein